VGDHLLGAVEGAEGTPGFDIGQASGELSVNYAPLLGRVLIIRGRELGKDGDHASGHAEFEVFAIPVAGSAADRRRHHERGFVLVLDSDGHGNSELIMV